MPLASLFRRRRFAREAALLYQAAVTAARDPAWYGELGVPDTLDGRFDMIAVFAFLLVDRARADPDARGQALAQAVFDAMFADMDRSLREMGVGDLSVAGKVKTMWEAFNGRARAYAAALGGGAALGDSAALGGGAPGTPAEAAAEVLAGALVGALAGALGRNVWRSEVPPPGARRLAGAVLRQRAHLALAPFASLAAGRVAFLPARESLARP